jgi:hypothetical protein
MSLVLSKPQDRYLRASSKGEELKVLRWFSDQVILGYRKKLFGSEEHLEKLDVRESEFQVHQMYKNYVQNIKRL